MITTIWDKRRLFRPLEWSGRHDNIQRNLKRLNTFLDHTKERARLINGSFFITPWDLWYSEDETLLRCFDGDVRSIDKFEFSENYYCINPRDDEPWWTNQLAPRYILVPLDEETGKPSSRDVAAVNGFWPCWNGVTRRRRMGTLLVVDGVTQSTSQQIRDIRVKHQLEDGGIPIKYSL